MRKHLFEVGILMLCLSTLAFSDDGTAVRLRTIYSRFRVAIQSQLAKDASAAKNNYLNSEDLKLSASKAIQVEKDALLQDPEYTSNPGEIGNMYDVLTKIIQKNVYDLRADSKVTGVNDVRVESSVIGLLNESSVNQAGALGIAKRFNSHILSDYRFMLGGAWTHSSDGGAAKGDFNAAMFARTRWYDERRRTIADIPTEHQFDEQEGRFLDLLVDAQFITNQPFNKPILDSVRATSGQFFLQSVASSKLGVSLFYVPWNYEFFDGAAFGVFASFEISTRDSSADIFRRVVTGLRIENRSPNILNSAAIELGITRNRTAGSLENDKEIFGANRIVLNVEMPIRELDGSIGLYTKFHGEWPLGHPEDENQATVVDGTAFRGLTSPPVFQFRLGATFDPLKTFGPLFGLPN